MQVKSLGPNKTEVYKSNGDIVFISYSTPVAANVGNQFYRTAKHWSRTTSKHITQWLDGAKAEEKPQEYFDNLI